MALFLRCVGFMALSLGIMGFAYKAIASIALNKSNALILGDFGLLLSR
jgi:hypothetical protein